MTDTVSWRQDQAANATIYILRNMGPTGFLLKEDGEEKNFKVFLGDPHRCTCAVYMKEKDLCKHICWALLKKFRIPRQNPITWQLGLVEREINELLRGQLANQQPRPSAAARQYAALASPGTDQHTEEEEKPAGMLEQRPISDDDVCPICQDELLAKHLPVTYCKFGCGNSVHIKCMKVWAEHQMSTGDKNIKCPFCREDFGPLSVLKQEMRNCSRETNSVRLNEHLGVICKKCEICPIVGKCYKCSTCTDYHLCQTCFNTATHLDHSFQFRQRSNQRWRATPPRSELGTTVLPDAIINNLMNRDITETDYDMLLQLDNQSNQELSDLTEETVRSFPIERVRPSSTLLAPGQQCRVCLRAYQQGQQVRRLPCRHKFHVECIDNWLLHQHPTCPVDGTVYTNQSVVHIRQAERNRTRQNQSNRLPSSGNNIRRNESQVMPRSGITLEIPGIGIARRQEVSSTAFTRARYRPDSLQRNTINSTRSPDSISITGSVLTLTPEGNRIHGSERHPAAADTTQPVEDTLTLQSPVTVVPSLANFGLSATQYGTVVDNVMRRLSRTLGHTGNSPHRTYNDDVIPQPPSIPLPHNINDSLSVSGQSSASAPNSASQGMHRKPPTGGASETDPANSAGRKGRTRYRSHHKQTHHPRSCSRERTSSQDRGQRSASCERAQRSAEPVQEVQTLYVGHSPSTRAPILAGNDSRFGSRLSRSSKTNTGTVSGQAESRYRWGNTQNISGDDMMLAGSAVNR